MKILKTCLAFALLCSPAAAFDDLPTAQEAAALGLRIHWLAGSESFQPNFGRPAAVLWPDKESQEAYTILKIGTRPIARIDATEKNQNYARWGLFDPLKEEVAPLGIEGMRKVAAEITRQYGVLGRKVVAEEVIRPRTFLAVASDRGAIEVLDADKGLLIWKATVDTPNLPMIGPAINDSMVAGLSGSTLYIFDRLTGRLINERRVDVTPIALPIAANDFIYVVGTNGSLHAYQKDDFMLGTRNLHFSTTTLARPAVSADQQFMVWPSGTTVYTARLTGRLELWNRLHLLDSVVVSPTVLADGMILATTAGTVFRINYERNDNFEWRLPYSRDIIERLLSDGENCVMVSADGHVSAIDAQAGRLLWETQVPGAKKAVTITDRMAIVQDFNGGLATLDMTDGKLLSRVEQTFASAIENDYSDALYLRAMDGQIMCLLPAGQMSATYHPLVDVMRGGKVETVDMDQPTGATDGAAGTENNLGTEVAAPMPADNPFGAGDNPFGGAAENPFGGAAENPFGDGENPFGVGANPPGAAAGADNPFGN